MSSAFAALDGIETPTEVSAEDMEQGSSQHRLRPYSAHRIAFALMSVVVVLGFVAIAQTSRAMASNKNTQLSASGTISMVQGSCPAPPVLDGKSLEDMVQSSTGVLLIANPQMRCTRAVKGALEAKGMQYEEHDFETPFEYTPGASAIWDWLHCNYPNDKEGPTIMHSYVFNKGEFVGQGFSAASLVEQGDLGSASGTSLSCEQRFPEESSVIEHYMANTTTSVLLFGWLACPCTGIAQGRFATKSVCYEGRTWANPEARLMAYLQCKEAAPEDHSFVYFRDSAGAWKFVGNGFQLDSNAMPNHQFESIVQQSGASNTCHHANVKVNVFGSPLEECRVGSDMSGSWQDDGTCSEVVGGIHEICIESLPADFSQETHQPPWSEERAGKRHCVCIGAWSLYMTDASKHQEQAAAIMPHCKAIPETALTVQYLSNWKDWNGYPANVVKGIGELVERCLDSVSASEPHALRLKCGLRQRFEALMGQVADLHSSSDLAALRTQLGDLPCAKAS